MDLVSRLARRVLEKHQGLNPSHIKEVREDPVSDMWQIVRREIETTSPAAVGLESDGDTPNIFQLVAVSVVLERITELVKESPA